MLHCAAVCFWASDAWLWFTMGRGVMLGFRRLVSKELVMSPFSPNKKRKIIREAVCNYCRQREKRCQTESWKQEAKRDQGWWETLTRLWIVKFFIWSSIQSMTPRFSLTFPASITYCLRECGGGMLFIHFNWKQIFKLILTCILLLFDDDDDDDVSLPTSHPGTDRDPPSREQPSLQLPSTGLFELIAFCSRGFQNYDRSFLC